MRSASSAGAPSSRRSTRIVGVGRRERLEQHGRRVQLAAAPAGPPVEQLRPRHAEQQDRRIAAQVGDVLDQIEERLLAPVDVVEHDDERPSHSDRLEQLAERPGDLLDRRHERAVTEHSVNGTGADESSPRSARRCSGFAPSNCFSTSTTGQYVIPSP